MDTENVHLIEDADGVSVAVLDTSVDGAGVASKTTAASRQAATEHGLSPELMDELAELAAGKVRDGGLRLMGEGGLLVELTRHLMQAAVEAVPWLSTTFVINTPSRLAVPPAQTR